MRSALTNDSLAAPSATGRYIATDFSPKPVEFAGVKCRKCHSTTVFSSRTSFSDLPYKSLGLVACRCGGCLHRFWVPFWRAKKRRYPGE